MEHLLCLSSDELKYFIEITDLKIISETKKEIILKGDSIFVYIFDNLKQTFCFQKGLKS